MNRFFVVSVLAMSLTLSGCNGGGMPTSPTVSPDMLTAVAQPPPVDTPTLTPTQKEKVLVDATNKGMDKITDPLSKTLDSHYQVLDVHFIGGNEGQLATLKIEVRCECTNNVNCCTVERTFVMTAKAMKAVFEDIVEHIPPTIVQVQVFCSDHVRPLGMAVVNWNDLAGFYSGTIGGDQLGNRVTIIPAP